jgi:23S rRNA pseudouridine1911/1915/1917 synthase
MADAADFRGDPQAWSARFVPGFRVVDETDDWLVLDKPAPLQVHPANPLAPPTLLDGLRELLAYDLINGARLSIINRLDRETSGLVLVAKNRDAARVFGKAMMRREVEKTYLAIVHGAPTEEAFSIDAPLRRLGEVAESPVYLLQAVHPDGAPSQTSVRVVRQCVRDTDGGGEPANYALVEARPGTGRMHQIRVHLARAGHPVLGDKLYGAAGPQPYLEFIKSGWTSRLEAQLLLPRHALHASRLAVDTDSFGSLSWESLLPADLAAFVSGPRE